MQQNFVYSVPVGPKPKGETAVHRHKDSIKELLLPPKGFETFRDIWANSVKLYPQNKCLEDLTYAQVDKLTDHIGSWMAGNKHNVIYIHSHNSVEWILLDIAAFKYGVITVPLYDTLGKEAIDYTFGLTAGTIIFSTRQNVKNLLAAKPNFSKVKTLVKLQPIDAADEDELKKAGINILDFSVMKEFKFLMPPRKVRKEDIGTINFTSGTTGLPKGVIVDNWAFTVELFAIDHILPVKSDDVHMSFLPLAHIFERFMILANLKHGSNVKFFGGNVQEITKDLARIKPTTMPIVPRLLNLFYSMLRSFPWVDKETAEVAWEVKKANFQKGILTSPYDQVQDQIQNILKFLFKIQKVFNRVKALFGGRLRLLVTGSAPISAEVLTFFRITLGCDIREGYGQTETCAASFVTALGDVKAGHVGGVNRSLEYKLVDLPELNYSSEHNPPTGQICVRGACMYRGYYKDEKNTKEAIDGQGWHHTGDVGLIEPNGALRIIDRKKNIYKLSQGEYVAPEKVQNIYVRCPLAAQVFLYGDSLQSFNVAVVFPNKDVLMKVLQGNGFKGTFEEACKDPKVTEMVLNELNNLGKKEKLFGFEQAKKLTLHPLPFGTYGIFTSTMKLQRHIAKKAFQKEIAAMYSTK